MKKQLFITLSILGISTFGFGQNQTETTKQSSTVSHADIIYKQPADATWSPVPADESLVPFMINKIKEDSDTTKKLTIIHQTAGSQSDILSLFDQVKSVFGLHWDTITSVQKIKLISPADSDVASGPRKFNAVYRMIEGISQTPYRIEVVVVSDFDTVGNKGVLFIICPEYAYFDNRFIIEEARNSLVFDITKSNNTSTKS